MRIRRVTAVPETYAALLAAWYVVLLTLGIPNLPPAGHVAGAVTFAACLAGAAVSAYRLDPDRRRRTAFTLAAGFVASAAAMSLVTATTNLTVKALMKQTLAGRVVLAVVGACLFVGVVVAAASLARAATDRIRRTAAAN